MRTYIVSFLISFFDHSFTGKTKRQNKVWLFNITADPNEQNDLSRERPEDVARLLSRLKELDATSVPVFYPNNDPLADPAKHGNVWGPWW